MFHRNHANQSQGNTNTKQHLWTTSKDVNDREVLREQERERNDPNKFNVSVGAFNGNQGQGYYGNQQYYGERDSHVSRNADLYNNRDRHFDGNQSGGRDGVTSQTSTSYGYSAPFTRSDWDHYAVRHEDALIGDPIPFADDSLNPQVNYRNRAASGRNQSYDNNGRVAYGNRMDNDSVRLGRNENLHGNSKVNPYTQSTNYEGPVAFDANFDANGRPLKGNYASGSVIESGFDATRGYTQAWGSEPLWGRNTNNAWGGQPLFRDFRDNRTPLLPENPWTHNELGREYFDGRRDHLYKHTDDAYAYSNTKGKALNQDYITNDNTNYRQTTRHVPSAFNRSSHSSGSSVPQPPPAPHWNMHSSSHPGEYHPRSFTRSTDYTAIDPRDKYFSTRAPTMVTESRTTTTQAQPNNFTGERYQPNAYSTLNTGFVPTRNF